MNKGDLINEVAKVTGTKKEARLRWIVFLTPSRRRSRKRER
jgi:hypothetical protein